MDSQTPHVPKTGLAAGKRVRWPLLIEYIGSLLLLIGIGIVLVWGVWQQKRSILAQSQQAQTTLARIAEAQLVGTTRSADHVLMELAELHAAGQLVGKAREADFWQEFWRELPESSFQFATDAQGRIVAASRSYLLGKELDTHPLFSVPRAFQNSSRLFISSPDQVLDDERAIVLSRPVISAQNELRGVVAVVLPCANLGRVLENFRISATQTATLIDESGALIARVPLPTNYAGPLFISSSDSMFMRHQRSGQQVSFSEFVSEIDGQEKIGAGLSVSTHPIQTNQSLTVVVSDLKEVVLAPWYHMLLVLWGYLVIALIAIWFGVVSYQRRRDNEGARALIEALLANPKLIVLGIRTDGTISLFNPAAVALTGYAESEALGRDWLDLCALPEDRERVKTYLKQLGPSSSVPNEYASSIRTRLGEIRAIAWRTSMIRDRKGLLLIGLGTDITEFRLQTAELETQAQIDVLTGVPNRRHFLTLANKALSQARRHGHALSLLMLDIDHFKAVNDSYGHHAGDLVLQGFARTCEQALRTEDLLGRLGGEEFGVLLPETGSAAALVAAERIRQGFADISVALEEGRVIRCTVSIGAVTLGVNEPDCETLLQLADKALYAAKRGGRNRVVMAEPAV
ncbi:diguanylate cyclase [Uliginosibacterium sp. 31-16]|uniref:sensor domain-containing diguanylate cyclase n=1 Tax=Uliginosibacterium sp. 31-16 TaxID=3068315 RepID=UPI00273E0E19|nr:diguanylate cyclase [Uliginosibacterium sp. 31-16]MDP5239678.1 diguanylate cyclase [Uliginosibacterium sp. 31-16]